MMLYAEGDTPALEDDAKGVLSLLWNCYPGHPWSVRCTGGCIFIRHMGFRGNWGMNIRVREFDHDAAVLKKKIIMLAGEWLERAGMVRGRYEEDSEGKVEGVPEKKSNMDVKIVLDKNENDLRETARPQVKEV